MEDKIAIAMWIDDEKIGGSVISLFDNVKEPRKLPQNYMPGDLVKARCRGFSGLHRCVLGKIGDPSEKKVFLDQIDSPIFLELVEKYAKHHMHNAVPTYTATPEQEDMAAPPQKSTAGPNASLTKKKDDAKKKKDLSDRQKKLEAAAANLELTELSAEMERTSGFEETVISSPSSTTSSLTTSTSTVTSSLVRESLQLTIPQENVVRPTFHQVTSCHTCQQLEKDVAQLNLRNHSLEVKVSQLESHLSTLWNWTSQIQQEINKNAAHSYSNQYQHQNSNGAASIDAEDASASNNATSSKEKVIAGYTMDQLEWKVSHLGSYSKTAKLLFRTLFTEEEYRNKTLTGTTKGKGAVDQDKLSVVYQITQKKFPGTTTTMIRSHLCDLVKPSRGQKKRNQKLIKNIY